MNGIAPGIRTPALLVGGLLVGAAIAAGAGLWLRPEEEATGVVKGVSAAPPTATATRTASEASLALAGELDGEPKRDPPYTYASLPAGYVLETVGSGLENPASLDGAPDGRVFIAEQFTGRVRVMYGGVLLEEPFFTVPDLRIEADRGFVSELGLVGLLVEPGPPGPVSLLLYYSAESVAGRRSTKLVRVRQQDGRGVLGETLLEIPEASACCHIGGALTLAGDGTLLVGVGDHEQPEMARSFASLVGKVLRINLDGTAASDNPFIGNALADDRIYALGLRNPFGVADGFVLDNGVIGFDAIFRLKAGADYGWPASSNRPSRLVEEPLELYLESLGMAGATVYRGHLAAFKDDLLFCQFHRGGALHWFPDTSDGPYDFDRIVATGCSSGIRVLPDGNVYFLDYFEGVIYRIRDGG